MSWLIKAIVPAHSGVEDRKSTRLNSSHLVISYAVFCLKKKKKTARALCAQRCRYSTTASARPCSASTPLSRRRHHLPRTGRLVRVLAVPQLRHAQPLVP